MNNIVNKDIQLPVVGFDGKELRKITLDSEIFGIEPHMPSVHLAVKVDLANRRQATAKTKTRSEVSGGGKKPWRQKGTGRARAGSSRSPLWRHGGIVFGHTGTQNFKLKMNKLVHNKALLSVLSDKVANNNLIVLDNEDFAKVSTKEGVNFLKSLDVLGKKTLVVLDTYAANLVLSIRNINEVLIVSTDNLSVYDVLNNEKIIITEEAVKCLQGEEEEAI